MARVKLSEHAAKKLLLTDYSGFSLGTDNAKEVAATMPSGTYVVKVDQGVKKRGKQGLIELNVEPKNIPAAVADLTTKGFSNFIAEPMLPHNDDTEHYISFSRTRDGIVMAYSPDGGVDVEDNAESIVSSTSNSDIPLNAEWLDHVKDIMNAEHLSFVEVNPLVILGDDYHLLDCAALADSAGEYFANWTDDDVVEADSKTEQELTIAELDENSPASLKHKELNRDGSLWFLLSGGGASITLADESHQAGMGSQIGNYGEYSGGPTTSETYLYTKQILAALLQSNAPKKALVIAGGVANFTDVKSTFKGIIAALSEESAKLQNQGVKVFVRRGGPNEAAGLALMEEFLTKHDLLGSIYGSDTVLTQAVTDAMEYLHA